MRSTTILTGAFLAATAFAAQEAALKQLLAIAPTANTCDAANTECITASAAIDNIIASFKEYNINTTGEQVALLAWQAFESVDFKFWKNHSQNTPGQGTRCMMSPEFVQEYAAEKFPEIKETDKAKLLEAVIKAGGEWGGANWFYQKKCDDSVKNALKARTGTKQAYSDFLTKCVNTGVNDRMPKWNLAATALSLPAN